MEQNFSRKSLACVLALAIIYGSEALLHSQQTKFTIGAWLTTTGPVMVKKFTPMFVDYLGAEVGTLYDPPLTFEVVPYFYDASNSPQAMIAAGKLDFAYHCGGGITCMSAEYGYTPIATQVASIAGYEMSFYGAVIFSAKSNTEIKNISDFRGKRLGVGYPWAPASFLLASEYLELNGLNIYTQFSQVVFYLADYTRMMNDVISGRIDVATTQSGWIEANAPQNIPLLMYHNLINVQYHSETYPFPTATRLVPSYAVTAAPHITSTLQEQVAAALRRLNSSHPAAKSAGIANFVLPASYEDARRSVERLGLMVNKPQGKVCRSIFEGLEHIIACPTGYSLKDLATVRNGCPLAGIACPPNMTCFCSPCELSPSNVFPWQLVLGLCVALFAVGLCFRVGWLHFLRSQKMSDSFIPDPSMLASLAKDMSKGLKKAASITDLEDL